MQARSIVDIERLGMTNYYRWAKDAERQIGSSVLGENFSFCNALALFINIVGRVAFISGIFRNNAGPLPGDVRGAHVVQPR